MIDPEMQAPFDAHDKLKATGLYYVMPRTIWVCSEENESGILFWSCGKDERFCEEYEPAYAFLDDGAMLAVEENPGFGCGAIGPMRLMIDAEYDHCDGFGAFYRRAIPKSGR